MSAIEGKADIQLIMAKPAREPLSIRTFEPVRCLRLSLGAAMRRRDFIKFFGSTALWPLSARAQQPTMPVIGYLSLGSRESDFYRLTGLRQGLNETGYVEGRNLTVEHRWAENQIDRLPALAAQLVQMRVAVIVTPGLVSTLPAKAATDNIPILFAVAADPVPVGLVASLNRPGGNLTGFNALTSELGAKQIALFHELLPNVPTIGFLENPSNQIDELMTQTCGQQGSQAQ